MKRRAVRADPLISTTSFVATASNSASTADQFASRGPYTIPNLKTVAAHGPPAKARVRARSPTILVSAYSEEIRLTSMTASSDWLGAFGASPHTPSQAG